MAVYKPTDCVPSGNSFDALNDRPIFIECKIDTNNAIVNGYSLELFDEDNNKLWSADSGTEDYSVQQTDNITLVVDLKRFFNDKFSQYGRGYQNLNTGINGSYLKIPIIYDAQPDIEDYGTFSRNTPPESVLSNGKTYRWKITLYQEMVSGDATISYPLDQIYYDMIVSTGKVIGSTSQRIQTALVADDEDLVDGLVLIDKYIQPVSIDSLEYNPSTPKDWRQEFGNNGIVNSGVRSLIENYDDIYGHIYPSQSGDNAFSEYQITLDSGNNGFRIYKNGNDPKNLGVSDKVYEIINYPVDMEIAKSELRYYDYNPSEDRTIVCDAYINIPASTIVDTNNIWVQTLNGNVLESAFVSEATYGSGENQRREIYITCPSLKAMARIYNYEHAHLFPTASLYYSAKLPLGSLDNVTEYNRWSWIDTPANLSQSHWKQVYTTTTNPSENGYRPFDGYPSGAPNITIYGKERIIFNHMYTGGAYSGSGDDRKYMGSCYNGIFSPDPSAEKVDGENKWNVTINWYRTTDANTWGLLLNKVVYVENGSTTPPDEVDGDVLLQSGANAEITIGSTSGVLNQTPFMFVSEKPIRLFNTVKMNTTDSGLVPTNVGTTNIVYLIETTEPIGEVLSVKINGSTIPSNTWSYIVKSQNIFYTPSNIGSQPETAEVVYKQYREQDYTGVIFYNQILDNHDNVGEGASVHPNASLVYIKPFVGIEPHMIIKFSDDVNVDLSPIDIINTKYWFVIVRKMLSGQDNWTRYNRIKNVDTKYQICSNYRDSDYNEFSLAENPELVMHVYDSMSNEISSEEHDDLFYEIKTRTFSAEIEYNQADYILWESCQWDLYTADRMLDKFVTKEFVTSSSEKYDGKLRFVFFGLEDKKYYILRSTIMTNNGGKFSQDTILYAQYSEQSTQRDNSTIDFNYDDLCVEINVSESLLNAEDVANSMIRIYKREVWYYEDQVKSTYGNRFAGDSSPWYLISENALAGVIYKDYCVASGHHYEYLVCRDAMVPVEETTEPGVEEEPNSDRFVSKEVWAQHLDIEVKYMGWSIIELHDPQEIENGRIVSYTASPKDVWRFKYNVSSGAQVQNVSRSQQDTLGGYPKISVGEKNFMSGSVSALLGREIIQANYRTDHYRYVPERIIEVDNTPEIVPGYWTRNIDDNDIYNVGGYREELSRWQYPDKTGHYKPMYVNANTLGFRGLSSNESVNMINAWKDVVYSGNDKLMKDEKGRMFLIHILSNSVEPNDSWTDMPTQISFDWVEVSNVKNISVYENEPNDSIIINGKEDVDGNGYVPANKYLGRNGAVSVTIKNPQYINGFGHNAFYGCTNIRDVYIDYPDTTDSGYDGPPVEEDLFDWWCKLDFENEASNPILVSPGENNGGVRLYKQNSNMGVYHLCTELDCGDDPDNIDDRSGYLPSKYALYKYQHLYSVSMLYHDRRVDSPQDELFYGCSGLQNVYLKNVDISVGMFAECESLKIVGMNSVSIINANAFKNCSSIKEIVIPDTVISIGYSAFNGCTSISNITIPFVGDGGGVNTYFGYIFGASEYDMQNDYLPKGISVVLNANNNISDYAFYGCSKLSAIDTAEWGGSSIGAYAFYECDGLTAFNIPETVRSIGDYAFSMSGLTSVAFEYYDSDHHTGTTVGYHVFENCTNLNSAHLGSRQSTTISAYTFAGCSKLESVVLDIYGSYQLWSIGDYAFYNCYSLSTIDASDIDVIGNSAFERSGLSSLTISSTVTSIGTDAFRASKVEIVKIINRSRQLTIGSGAFEKCESLLKVVYLGATVDGEIVSIDGWFNIGFEDEFSNPVRYSENLYYTTGTSINDEQQELNRLRVPNVSVNNYAFYNCKSLTYVTFTPGDGNTKNIGDYAFYDCSNIEFVGNMKSSYIMSIGDYAFYNMQYYFADGVDNLVLPDNIAHIGQYAFYNLGIRIGVSEDSNKLYITGRPDIGINAFLGAKISDVYYIDEVLGVSGWTHIIFNSLYANPLYQCGANLYIFESNSYTKVVNIMFADSINNIPQYAFAGCTIETIGFNGGESVSVDDYAFYNCSKLRGDYNEDLPHSIYQIGDYAFSGTIVRNVTSNVTSVGVGAFADSFVNHVALTGFTGDLPEKLFSGCSNLWFLNLSSQTTSMSTDSLYGCTGLTTLWAHVDIIDSFKYKMNLQNITAYLSDDMHGDVRNVPDDMLIGSTSITSVSIIGSGYISSAIGSRAFYNCSNLSSVSINDVYTVGSYAFANTSVSSITITDDIQIIQPYAFYTNHGGSVTINNSHWSLYNPEYPSQQPIEIYTQEETAQDLGTYLFGYRDAGYYHYRWEKQ